MKQQLQDLQEEKVFSEAEYAEKLRTETEEKQTLQAELDRIKTEDAQNVSFSQFYKNCIFSFVTILNGLNPSLPS